MMMFSSDGSDSSDYSSSITTCFLLKLLPKEIYISYLKEYLSHEEFRWLLSVSKNSFFSKLKYEVAFLPLKKDIKKEIIKEIFEKGKPDTFGRRVLGCVADPRRQLDWRMEILVDSKVEEEKLIKLGEFTSSIQFCYVKTNPSILDPSLYSSFREMNVSRLNSFTSGKKFENLQKMVITSLHLTDVSALSTVPHIEFQFCCNILDFRPLVSVKVLILRFCRQRIDVSSLIQLEKLQIDNCQSPIILTESLINLQELSLIRCDHVNSIPFLPKLRKVELILPADQYLRNIETLTHVPQLSIENCSLVHYFTERGIHDSQLDSTLSLFQNLSTLSLPNCVGLTDVSGLTNIRVLNISNCQEILEIPANCMKRIRKLEMNYCLQLKKLGHLPTLKELSMIGCKQFNYVDPFAYNSMEKNDIIQTEEMSRRNPVVCDIDRGIQRVVICSCFDLIVPNEINLEKKAHCFCQMMHSAQPNLGNV